MMMFPEEIVDTLDKAKVVAGFSVDKVEHAVPIAKALFDGGIKAIELTLRTSAGIEAVREIARDVPEILLGVGTILTAEQVLSVKEAGAAFGVAPGMNPTVIRASKDVGFPFAPGIATPSDLEAALELGCRFVKFFPAEAMGGVKYLQSAGAPYKHLGVKYFPLGGVNLDNFLDYLAEPNIPVIGGSWIVKNELVMAEDWEGIKSRALEVSLKLKENGYE